MQDSNIVFKITAVGIPEATAQMNALSATVTKLTVNANGTVTASGKLTSTLDGQQKTTDKVTSSTKNASSAQESYFAHIAKTTIQSALVNKAFLLMVDSMGKAVQQADLISNFPASMAALGLSATDASEGFAKLKTYIQSVGGDLVKATTSVARFAGVNKDIKASVAEFAGLNNALIAGGASADVQASALEQMTQAYSRGKPQLIEWKSALVAMAPQLDQVAKKMGFINAGALGDALTKGDVSMQTFMTNLTQMGTGTGPIAQQAIARMQGIQFASTVMQNALTNGLTAIYTAIGRQNIVAFFSFLTQVITTLASWVVVLINGFTTLFNTISGAFGGSQIGKVVGETAGVADNLGAGADAADAMGNGLDDAGKSADKLSKSLAGFDKMNVLADKTSSGKTADTGTGVSGLDTATANTLNSIFDSIGGKIQEATVWAKIFSGVIAGIVALKFGQGILNQLNGMIKTIQTTKTNVEDLSKKLDDMGKKAGTALGSASKAIGNGVSNTASSLGSALSGFLGGIAASIGLALGPAIDGIIVAVSTALLAVAGFLGIPVWALVAIITAVVAAIVAIVWVVAANWDAIWSWIKTAASNFGKWITGLWNGLVAILSSIWSGIVAVWTVVWNTLVSVVTVVIGVISAIVTPVINAIVFVFQLLWSIVSALVGIFLKLVEVVVVLLIAGIIALAGLIASVFGAMADWFMKNVITPIVNIFTAVIKTISDIFTSIWNAIVAIFIVAATWFDANVIQPVIALFTTIITAIAKIASDIWNGIVAVFIVASGWFNANVITPIVNLFTGIINTVSNVFTQVWNGIKSVFGGVWSWFKTNVIDNIVNLFTGLISTIANIGNQIWNGLTGGLKGIINGIIGGIEWLINALVDGVNALVNAANKVVGFTGLKISTLPRATLPRLAQGGVAVKSTIANIGENGAEAIVPLENNTEWIDKIASKLNAASGGGQPIQLTVQIGEDKIITKVIDLINEKTQMSGRNAILV